MATFDADRWLLPFGRQNPAYNPICFFNCMKEEYILENKSFAKKKNFVIIKLTAFFAVMIAIFVVIAISVFFILKVQRNKVSIKTIQQAWKEYDYHTVYELSKIYLQDNPFNNTALTYYSYACFFLSQAQTDTLQAQTYLDESIINLRIALYEANDKLVPQLQYMLGRAYFYKDTISTHYYADLAIKYLLMAKENGYEADDIAEYMGLSYASLGMTMESISAFTEALLVRESDSLLLAIAEQYVNAKQYGAAEQYLFRIVKNSKSDEIIIKSEILLGNIYTEKGDFDSALKEFENVLKKNENSADAHYGIGVIYEKQGNLVKARAEWRKALKIQVNHIGALQKMTNS